MNFIKAIQHATIGYGIRRRHWSSEALLILDENAELRWRSEALLILDENAELRWADKGNIACVIGGDGDFDLNVADLTATDWETV